LDELKDIDYGKYDVINILGGEPLIHPEIIEILKYFGSNEFQDKTIILYTNGLLISKLDLKKYSFNINVLITFHTFGKEVLSTYNYTQEYKFYNNIRYQMLYTIENREELKKFNTNELAPEIYIGYDIYLDINMKHLVWIKRHLNNFNLKPVDLLFQKEEKNIVRTTDLILTNQKLKTEYHEGFQFCLLKYHFQW